MIKKHNFLYFISICIFPPIKHTKSNSQSKCGYNSADHLFKNKSKVNVSDNSTVPCYHQGLRHTKHHP